MAAVVKPGFHYTANITTKTQKQSDHKIEQSFFTLIPLFDSKMVIGVVVIGPRGATRHKFGQGCPFVDIFRLPKKITGSKF